MQHTKGGSTAATGNSILLDNKCGKCNKVVRNGILCDNCDKWYHFNKCSTVSEDKIPDTQWRCVSCSTRNELANEKETGEYDNSEVLRKLIEEISSLREIISVLQSERIQHMHLPVHHEDDDNWCQIARGKSRKTKKVVQHSPVSTCKRFNSLNEVAEEIEQRKELCRPKVNVKKKKKLIFYSDIYGRDIPTALSKTNVDISVYGEVRPGAKMKDVLQIV
jgi:hypothetical protein